MTAPRIDTDLGKIEQNTRTLADRLGVRGIRVTGITKAVMGSPGVGAAMLRGGAHGLGDSRVPNLVRLSGLDRAVSRTLIRSPMLSQAARVVDVADVSLNTEAAVLVALDRAASRAGRTHGVVLMVELGDLREGIAVDDVPEAVLAVLRHPGLRLLGLGANLACQNGVVPDDRNMGVLTALVEDVESLRGITLGTVSGGNSANLGWAMGTDDVGRIDELRLGEAILLGVDPLHRTPIPGLHTDAFTLTAEVIEVAVKPAQPWGDRAQAAFGEAPVRTGSGRVHQAILALGRQDVDPEGLHPPAGIAILGMSSDHLVVDIGDHGVAVGDEIDFGVAYGALVRAMTSPFVTRTEHPGDPVPERPGPRVRIPSSAGW
ncbi:alanine/ornithine racemase family PLP-dependent enzyme [Pseudonocardia sp. KRD-184]|uniref:Alanine/ornithine racemase family PLP-dependent enzyme n=1 Tax=Pseudonocardia oceani TaxID=2792013 RepID=A0ABS6U8Z3_9PSEU|nr:alanine/ornithine racemase family PLP-dependent enzyme [Pseudonocardia oceani]MBW0088660.1 alanine/ornithine racemase family PLP-dependent enzyme [Pseudonocardia oceani]MBW0095520.1 alanine/ornithine racemase family PLP-dependent enzyme [Pseudonocardia oceani]MBW0108499.1 alanine/ornithine racemase family PLP-dependent enzyme [Pseudonocardia oceani]MBW0121531.1 alanine/ornithine racemase family PLP-dependent enzyme [Pseudonocardia oceani]MBW0128712.1 alanine/ornithine racemase family PLP-de